MPQPRIPTSLLHDRGSFDKHPERLRARAGEPNDARPLGDPPGHLSDVQRDAWLEVVANAPPNVLARADRLSVELAAVLLVAFRERGADLHNAKLLRLEALLKELGMTPASRSRVTAIPPPDPANPFAALGRRTQ